nr:MAG: nonstructural protein [Microvirus sp.]
MQELKNHIHGLYVIKDKVADDYSPIFQAINNGVAIRNACVSLINVHDVRDYELIKVGEVDVRNAQLQLCKPEQITFYEAFDIYLKRHIENLRITHVDGKEVKREEPIF